MPERGRREAAVAVSHGSGRGRPSSAATTALGSAIRGARVLAGYSQAAIAESIDTEESFISQVERGRRSLSDERLLVLERCLGCRPGELVAAAARDGRAIRIPSGIDDRDDVLIALAVKWRALTKAQLDVMRRVLA